MGGDYELGYEAGRDIGDMQLEDKLKELRDTLEQKIKQERDKHSTYRNQNDLERAEQCIGSISAYYDVIGIIDGYKKELSKND